MSTPFHYAFKVKDLSSTRKFYMEILGCQEGRSTETWIDFNFFGNQLSAHVSRKLDILAMLTPIPGILTPLDF